jgi:hypothetical protein
MMVMVRGSAASPPPAAPLKMARTTPAYVENAAGNKDYFCLAEPDDVAGLREAGWQVIELRDGWYEDDTGGGVAIWGFGKYWEVRDTPFTVRESCAPSTPAERASAAAAGEQVNVRGAIFGV